MSFVIATPDLVQGAAQDLAGIRSSLAEATAIAAGPTTGVAAAAQDEVSIAIASMFGGVGQEFQALSAQAQAFHAEFVSAMNGSAAAYVSAEAAAGQTLMSAAAAPAQTLLGGGAAMVTGQATPTLIQGIESFGAAVAAPYQQLVINTNNNLAAINQTFMANPFPFANQVIINQAGFANTFGSGIVTDLQGFPANVPANIQLAFQGAATFSPGLQLQNFMNGQIGTAQTVITSLQATGNALMTGAPAFSAGVQTAFQDLLVGNNIGAYSALQQGLQSLLLPGFEPVTFNLGQMALVPVVPMGPLEALAPIIALPGQMAQSFTNLLPPGSILAQMSQNATNTINALTNLNTTINPAVTFEGLIPAVNFGAGLQLVFDSIGAPGNALAALNSTGVAFTAAVQAGNPSAAALALLDAPANMTNGFLNGSTLITLPPVNATVSGIITATTTTEIPLGGLLTPLSLPPLTTEIDIFGSITTITATVPGSTEIGGLIPGLQSIGSQLAQGIAVPAPAAAVAAAAAPSVAQGIGSFGAAVAAPYQQLVIDTSNNLAAINSTYAANPHPLLTQFMNNQMGYAQTFGSGIVTDLQGFPGNVPANIQLAIQGASTFNPGALGAAFINGQIGTAQTVIGSLQATGNALMTGAPAFQAGVQTAFQDLLVGNNVGAYGALQQGLQSLFLPGFEPVAFNIGESGMIPVIPMGPLEALAPIIMLPGQMAQSFTNLLPPGSILAQMSQNATNTISALTNLNTTLNLNITADFTPATDFGVGLQLTFDALGAPGLALSGLNSSAVAFTTAVQAGNLPAAAAAVLDAPAVMTNSFLNGSTVIDLPPVMVSIQDGFIFGPATVGLPLGGLLTPLSLPSTNLASNLGPISTVVPGSSETGGLIPGLQSIDAQLAAMITPPM
jgi:PE family